MAATKRNNTGRSSQFWDKGPVLAFTFPGTVDTASNALIPCLFLPVAVKITVLKAFLKTAPTGQAMLLDFKKVTLSTGALSASIGQVSISAAAFTGSLTLSTPVDLATTEGLVMEVTQVGSGTPGSNLTGEAFCS